MSPPYQVASLPPLIAPHGILGSKEGNAMNTRETITKFYKELDRSYFMDSHKKRSQQDTPFPIGYGQTISQPSLVLEMTVLLDIGFQSNVLEIGTGSGYQTALLAKAAAQVYTIERIEALHLKAIERLGEAGYTNIQFKLGDGSMGWKEHAPFDRIMVTASPTNIPKLLLDQLAPNGKMVIPVGPDFVQDLLLIHKDSSGKIRKERIAKVSFVRLIGDY